MGKVAVLVYQPWKPARRKDDSFDGLSNIGMYLLIHELNKAGIEVSFCSPESAYKYDLILISFTSNYDILSFYKSVYLNWKGRKFITVGGGFGMQNPIALTGLLDFAFFGRAENIIVELVKNYKDFQHESYMKVSEPKISKINQAEIIYPDEFPIGTNIHKGNVAGYRETIMGCPNKCFYCHYSWARKHVNTGNHYESSLYAGSQELDMFNLDQYRPNCPQVTVGLDGYSERLRKLVNRNTTNEQVKEFIIGISEKTQIKGRSVFLKLYNIIGYETETENDFIEFRELVREIEPKLKKRILLTTHSTPLRPSPCTPLAYSAMQSIAKLKKEPGKTIIKETDKLCWFNSRYEESEYGRFETILIERFTEEYRGLINFIISNSKFNALKSAEKMLLINQRFNTKNLYREYDVKEQLPTWFLEGYTPQEKIRKMRLQMKSKMMK